MNKLFSFVFGLLLLLFIAEEVITSFDLIEVSETIEKELESDESDSDEKEEEIQFAKFFIEDEYNIYFHNESDSKQNKVKPVKSIGKTLSSLSNPPYSPPEFN